MKKTSTKTISYCLALLLWVTSSQAATVDLGFTLGKVVSGSTPLSGTAVRLGFFTGYNDTLGTSFFTSKTHDTLFASFKALDLAPGGNPDTLFTGSDAGLFYSSYVTHGSSNYSDVTASTRLFAWFWSSATPSSSANWAVISGTIGGTTDYDPAWLAPAPDPVNSVVIEAGVIASQIYAESAVANAIQAVIGGADPLSANLSLIPEPSSLSLLAIGLASLVASHRKAKQVAVRR